MSRFHRTKKFAFWLGIVLSVAFLSLFARFYLIKYVPHKEISMVLPWAPEDDELIFINPMGEKVEHADSPHGHPGIDFGWHHPAPLRAVVDGKVTKIKEHPSGGHGETETIYDVEVISGIFAVRYQEIAVDPNIKMGSRVKQGDVIGRGGRYKQEGGLNVYYSTHWEFDYNSPIFDRLCPMTYFTSESQQRINAIWAKVGQTYDGKYPEICSADYIGRDK